MSYNKVMLMGRLTADPEVKQTTTGKAVMTFTLAVQRDKEHTEFIDLTAWEKTANFIGSYFRKGDGIFCEGNLIKRQYDDKEGKKRYVLECVCDSATFTEGRKTVEGGKIVPQNEETSQSAFKPSTEGGTFTEMTSDDDLPF